MELNLKKVQQLNPNQIYDLLQPTINKLYLSFIYISISNEEYEELIIKEISDSKKQYKGDQKYSDYIKRKIRFQLSEITKKQIFNPKTSFTLLNNYITAKIINISDYINVIQSFNKLSNFLETYNYIPTPDLLIELINKNNTFNQMVATVFKEHYTQIISGKVEELFNDSLLLSTINAYCMLNNIDIAKTENISLENYDLTKDKTTDSYKMYLREIEKRPLLSPEQERQLAIKIAEGDSNAREIFIESNLKLVVSIAQKYINRGLSLLDLIQEGSIGLMIAVDKYDANKGYKFSTYATYWIKQSIIKAIETKGRNIRIPVHLYGKVRLYKKTITKMEDKLGRSATVSEIANEMGLSISEVSKLQELQWDTLSINATIGDEDTELENFISSSEKTPEDKTIDETLLSQINLIFEKCNLESREKDILMLRYGFNNREPMTLEEIGKKYNLTRERVRQIEAKAIMKIRRSKYVKELAVYTNYPDKSLQNINEFRKKYRKMKNPYYKTLLNDYKHKEGKDEEEMPKLQTIYEYFKDYTKEQIDEMLTKLTEEEKALLIIRYGEDLNNPASNKLTQEQTNRFYGTLIPTMKRLLTNPTKERNSNQRKKKAKQPVANQTVSIVQTKTNEVPKELQETLPPENNENQVISTIIMEDSDEQKKIEQQEHQEKDLTIKSTNLPKQSVEQPTNNNNQMSKEDYIKVLELLRTPTFAQMMSTLSVKEAVIISLRLGYIDGKYYSTESIAKFLGIEPLEVIETTKKILLVYKENINRFLDNAIAIATDETKKEKYNSQIAGS